jgi:hypothetical protein
MTQKADQQYNRDYQDAYGRSESQNKWIWGALAALAALAAIVWFASGPSTGPSGVDSTATQSTTTAPAVEPAPAEQAPAAPAVEPAPATGNNTNQ